MGANFLRWLLVGSLVLLTTDIYAGPKIESWQASSGARVMFVSAPDLPMLDVRVVFDAGSARDGDKPGLAMLTNAVMTDAGGPWDVDQVADRLESVGAILGAGSRRDMSWASMRTLTDQHPKSVALETLRALLIKPRFDEVDLERSRQAVLVSLRRVEQSPGSIASRDFWKTLYGDHPYASFKRGNEASIKALTRTDLLTHYGRYYTARNAVVVLVGAIDRPEAEAIAEQLTQGLPEGDKAPALVEVTPLLTPVERKIPFASTQSHILLGHPSVSRGDPDYFALYVGNHILGGNGLNSILSDEVREKRGLSYSVYSYFSPMRKPGPFVVGVQTKSSNTQKALDVIHQTLKTYIAEGPSEAQLQAAKQNITGGFPLRISSNGKIIEYLAMIGFYGLPLDYLDVFVARIDAITQAQVKSAFERRVKPEKFVTVVVGNGQESKKH